MTNSETEMGQFKNHLITKILGWISVLALTFLNLYNLPQTFEGFGIWNKSTSDILAWTSIIIIITLLIWTCTEMVIGDRKFAKEHKKHSWEQSSTTEKAE